MKVNLKGLFSNAVDAMPAKQRKYYGFCLDEVLGHIQDVVDGKHTIEEFAEHYCLHRRPPISEPSTNGEAVDN